MAVSREDVRRNLVAFAQRWSLYRGSERSEAQTFLNELFACYGADRLAGAQFEAAQEGKFLDLIWPRRCIIEMKRPAEASRLARHRAQARAYWERSADPERNVPAPRWLVLCAFQEFEIWEPGAYPAEPRLSFSLLDLPDQLEALMFLAGEEPLFSGTQAAVTEEAVRLVTDLYRRLSDRRAAARLDTLRDFALQSVWCMFAEDLGQLPAQLFSRLLEDLAADSRRSSADDLGQLFQWLNRPGPRPSAGLYRDTLYVNGGLFVRPAEVHLDIDELTLLRLAAERDWRKVEPSIFGKLMEGALGAESRRGLGAHYTHEADIQKIVGPTIVAPWTERVENAKTLADVQSLQDELLSFTVLDPACGSGNFLYVALYNRFDDGAFTALRARHRDLDHAVARAYGWPVSTVDDSDDVLRRLIALNLGYADHPQSYAGP